MADYDRYLASLEDRAMREEDERDLDTDAERRREDDEDLRWDYEPEGEK